VAKGVDNAWSVAKALGLRALTTGKFWQFCFLIILVALIWKVDSADWVRIVQLILGSPVVAVLGWLIAGVLLFGAVIGFRAQRRLYWLEITRLARERNALQEKLLGGKVQKSEFEI
jgi:hypothetical protein